MCSSTTRRPTRWTGVVLVTALVFGGGIALAPTAGASQIVVTSTADDGGPGTLRAAIAEANASPGASTIELGSLLTYELTDCGAGQLTSTQPLTIVGNGSTVHQTCEGERVLEQTAGNLTLEWVLVSGGQGRTSGGGVAAAADLTVDGGSFFDNQATAASPGELTTGGAAAAGGTLTATDVDFSGNRAGAGGALTAGTAMTLTHSTLASNVAEGSGGAIWIDNPSATGDVPLVLDSSSVVSNEAGDAGGGIFNANGSVTLRSTGVLNNTAGGDGGGVFASGALTMEQSVLSANQAGGRHGGGGSTNGPVTVSQSGVVQNTSETGSGGLGSQGAGTALTIERSIVAGNRATGAGATGGGVGSSGPVVVRTSTVTRNSAGQAGGGVHTAGDVTLDYATVVANGAAAASAVHTGASLTSFASAVAAAEGAGDACTTASTTSQGYNVEAATDSCGFDAPTDLSSVEDLLVAERFVADPSTEILEPTAGSPLLDRVPADHARCTGVDQRDLPRPQMGGCDAGAAEARAPTVQPIEVTATAGQARAVDVRSAVVDPAGLTEGATFRAGPAGHGTVDPAASSGGTVTYTARSGYTGADSFAVEVCPRGTTWCTPAQTVAVTVTGSGQPAATTPPRTAPAATPAVATPRFTG
ncbi:MAG: hypothetical protein JJU45_02505 [Acidimicrobiia bacterium]|nr:hypothetical protein [Acidimicrobiia bacterium]